MSKLTVLLKDGSRREFEGARGPLLAISERFSAQGNNTPNDYVQIDTHAISFKDIREMAISPD